MYNLMWPTFISSKVLFVFNLRRVGVEVMIV